MWAYRFPATRLWVRTRARTTASMKKLLRLAHPELAGDTAFALKPESTYEMDVPFSLSGSPHYLETYDCQYRDPVEGNEFAMLVANCPERVFLKFSAER